MIKTVLPLHSASLVPTDYNKVSLQVAPNMDSLGTSYRIYNEAMADWVRSRLMVDGKALPVIPSPPQNAFANMRTMLIELGVLENCSNNPRDYSNLPLPMASVHNTGEDLREGQTRFPLRNLGVYGQTNEQFTRYPKPMWFMYSIDLWARKKNHLAWMKHRMEMSFRDRLAHATIAHSPGPTKFITAIWREAMEDQSQVSRSENEELIMHAVLTVKVEAWMWDDILFAPRILGVNHENDDIGNEIFDTGANIRVDPTQAPPGDA